MKKIISFILVVLCFSNSFYAQKEKSTQKKPPVSIYTFNFLKKDVNRISSINKRLNLTSYEFLTVNADALDTNIVAVNFSNLGKKPSAYIYDDYEKYQNNNFLKGFLLKNDPTRWNLHCIENRIQPYFLKQE